MNQKPQISTRGLELSDFKPYYKVVIFKYMLLVGIEKLISGTD